MGRVRCKYGREISCRVLVGKLKGKRPLGRADENTKMDPKQDGMVRAGPPGSRKCLVAGFHEDGHEPSGSTKRRDFLD